MTKYYYNWGIKVKEHQGLLDNEPLITMTKSDFEIIKNFIEEHLTDKEKTDIIRP